MSYIYTQSFDEHQLTQILDLQAKYVKAASSREEIETEGFLTCKHQLETLTAMNQPHPHIIATHGEDLAGYCLCMMPSMRADVPEIVEMFDKIEAATWRGQQIDSEDYIVIGQVCVAKEHRRRGVFRGLYQHYKTVLAPYFKYCITEVATENIRSMNAHQAIGFDILHSYIDSSDTSWEIVIWDWAQ